MKVLSWPASRQLTVGSFAIVLAYLVWSVVLAIRSGAYASALGNERTLEWMLSLTLISGTVVAALLFFGGCIMILGFIRYSYELHSGLHGGHSGRA